MVRVGADTKEMERGLKTARARMKDFSGQIKKMGKIMAVAGAAVVGAIGVMVKSYIKAGDEVHKMALRTGFSTEKLSELKYASEISGASIEALEKGVKRMSKTINDATKAGGAMATYVRAFDQLGLEAEELIQLSAEDAFDKIARAIANIESPMIRAARAQDIFGRAGTQLLPLFAAGAEGLDELRKRAHELGIVFDQEAANKAAKLTDAITTLKGSIKGVSFSIAGEIVPALTVLVEAVTDVMTDIRGDAGAMTTALLGFFRIIGQGIRGLMLGFHLFQKAVFEAGEIVTRVLRLQLELWAKAIGLFAALSPKGSNIRKMYGEIGKTLLNLQYIEKGYREETEKQIDAMTDILVIFDKLFKKLDEADKGYKKTGEAITEGILPPARELADVLERIEGATLPAARKMDDILGKAVTKMTSGVYEYKTAWQETMYEILASVSEAAGAMDSMFGQFHANEAQRLENKERQETDALEAWFERERARIERTITNEIEKVAALEALDEEKARRGNALQVKMDKERRKLERARAKAQKASALFAAGINVAEAITKAFTAGPLIGQIFAGIVAALGAIQIAAIAAAPLPSLKEGGFVPKETLAHLHPGELVLPAPDVRALISPARKRGPDVFSPTVNIYTKYLDDNAINQAAEKLFARLEYEKGRFG